ncbi:MAG: response regulator [Rhodospirillales bacterium]|nr:response regulator [Rhodospirillales bacterium]
MMHKSVILAVDDTSASLKLLTDLLKEEGYEVHSAINGEVSLHSAVNNPPDLILLDILMAGMDGYEVCRRLKAHDKTRNIPVIFVSAMSSTEEKVQGFKLGAVDFVTKPYQRDELLARVRTHLELMNLRLHLEELVNVRTQEVMESEEKFRSITTAANDAIVMMDGAGKIVFWNAAAETMFGYSAFEAMGKELHTKIVPPRFYEAYSHGLAQFKTTGAGAMIGKTLELEALRKDSTKFPVEVSVAAVKLQGEWQAIGILRDITERKQTEASLARLNRALKTLSDGNRALVHAQNEELLMHDICHAATESGHYALAWAGYIRADKNKSIEPVAVSGEGLAYVEALNLTWADQPRGHGPTGAAARTGQTQVVQNFAKDPRMALWRDSAAKFGYASCIALPLKQNGAALGVLTIYATETDAFGIDEVALLEEMAGDLAYGIVTLRTRIERDQAIEERRCHLDQIRTSLETSIDTIAATVEMRDPYTAGHQRQVAKLAAAIARELGLPDEQVHGIHLAGTIHDLGKIHIPAEILSRPGKLSEIEFALVKGHAQVGYDILKEIKFPWPIAQMVLQHHERMDGTGYPQGLKGVAIILEARILAVADVVEAITSHRPYRAGLGIDAALAEIKDKRGILYDSTVVDACLTLFRERHFVIG